MRSKMKLLGLALTAGLVATGCSHSGYPLTRDYHNMSHRDLRVAHQGSHVGHSGHRAYHPGQRGGHYAHSGHHQSGSNASHRHFGYPQGYDSERGGNGYYSRDYRSGNGYHGNHNYGRRLPRGLTVSDRVRLDPWLNNTWEGNKFVRDHYDVTRYDTLDERNAENANVFFRRWADVNRDYRLTDEEIRTALHHTANGYSGPRVPHHHYPHGDTSRRPHHSGHGHHHRHHGHHRRPAPQPAPMPEPIIEEAPQIPYGERG